MAEKETRLAKRREALKKKTAEAKSKEKEYQRIHRQQKKVAEITEERENWLAKHREARRERTGNMKDHPFIEIGRFPRASVNGQGQQDRPTNNEVREKEKQGNEATEEYFDETNEIMVSEPTVYEVNEHLNTISVNQVIEMFVLQE